MKVKKIGIVGGGVVGRAIRNAYSDKYNVRLFDIVSERSTHSLLDALNSDIVFLCLPTPQKPNSRELDLSAIEGFCCAHRGYRMNFVLKSTVPIGTTRRLAKEYDLPNLVHSPEFLTERTADEDAKNPKYLIIGCTEIDYREKPYVAFAEELTSLYVERYPYAHIHHVHSDESEAIKLMVNSFFAVKVAFFNEMRSLSDSMGLDWSRVINGIRGATPFINPAHTEVPGHDGKRGFGGHCLVKDLDQMAHHLVNSHLPLYVTSGASLRNKRFDRPDVCDITTIPQECDITTIPQEIGRAPAKKDGDA